MNLALWIATGLLAAVALVGGISKAFAASSLSLSPAHDDVPLGG